MGAIENRIVDGLERLPLLRGLESSVVDRLAASAVLSAVPRDKVIFRQGEPCTGLYFIRSGQVKLSIAGDDGQEKVFDLLGPEAYFGESSLYLDKPHLVTAQAIVETQLVHFGKAALLQEIFSNAELAGRVIVRLAGRLYRRTDEVKSHMLLSGTQRVICYLLHEISADCEDSEEILLKARKGIIASRLHLTQEHFSRILHDLVSSGLIKVSGQRVQILDIARLRMRAVN
jgi:CRP-like cAMP-binding protein